MTASLSSVIFFYLNGYKKKIININDQYKLFKQIIIFFKQCIGITVSIKNKKPN